jgi:dolichol kinase
MHGSFDKGNEFKRKGLHLLGGLISVGYYFLDRNLALMIMFPGTILALFLEGARRTGRIRLPRVILRQQEEKKVAAYVYFIAASLLAILLFEKTIAILAILMLAVGDVVSGIAGAVLGLRVDGRLWETDKPLKKPGEIPEAVVIDAKKAFSGAKPFEVMMVMFTSCLIVGSMILYIPRAPDMHAISLKIVVFGALGATLAEAIPWRFLGRGIDDNLTIPLLSGLFMTIAAI